jgi:membrane-bound lytic murein transglycosylase D
MRKLGILLLALGLAEAGPARADETRAAGVQPLPPSPEAEREPLSQDDRGRRAMRGCPTGLTCVRVEDESRAFELEAFAPGSPWVERDHAPAPARGGEKTTRASDLRPDLAWLDELELPDLPVRWDDRLIQYLLYYKDDPRGRATMKRWLEAQGRYKDLIVERLRKARLPEDLVYVAMIESSYNPTVSSYAGAGGLWQLMPDGGRIYGLARDRWLDERMDPVKATDAVVDYWTDLHQRFGDWALSLAAYNAGYGAVLRAIARYNTNDFWKLTQYENSLPWDTALYVPKALAVAIIGHNRERFGFGNVEPTAAERWDDVKVPTSVSLSVIAKAAGCSSEDLARLNPQLRRKRTPPGRKDFIVRVPAGGGSKFARRFAELRDDWDGYDAYVVAYGERFEDVATQFGISERKLRELNDVDHESDVTGGSLLVVPRIAEATRKKNLAKAMDDLHASGVDQRPGEPLLVPVPDEDATIAGKRRVFYRVVIGDSLAGIAGALGTPIDQLAAWNDLAADAKLHPRMVLQAWVPSTFDERRANVRLLDDSRLMVVTRGSKRHLDLAEARVGRERVEYTPEKRESLERIGKKFGLGPRDLGRINRMSHTAIIEPGQTIIVYRVVDRGRSERAAEQWKDTPKSERGKRKPKPPEPDDVVTGTGSADDAAPDAASSAGAPTRPSITADPGTEPLPSTEPLTESEEKPARPTSDAKPTSSKSNDDKPRAEKPARPDEKSAKPDEKSAKPDEKSSKPDEKSAKPDKPAKPDEKSAKPDKPSKPDDKPSKAVEKPAASKPRGRDKDPEPRSSPSAHDEPADRPVARPSDID